MGSACLAADRIEHRTLRWARRASARGKVLALRLTPLALLALLGLHGAARADDAADGAVAPEYRLNGYVPSQVSDSTRATAMAPTEFFYRLPSSFIFDSLAGVNPDAVGGPMDHARATLRYTWLAHPSWAMKVGLSTTVEPDTTWQRLMMAASDRSRLNPMPAMHLSGQSQISERWMLSLDAEGQHWSRGQSLDMDLRIDYHLSPSLALFGSYRLTDNFGDNSEFVGFPVSNSARFGVRLRF
jgi:hypothetical protein